MGNRNIKDVMDEFISGVTKENLSEEEKEFQEYCQLFQERFGRNAYIAEPSGTMKKTIDAIKICIEKDEDILDELLYPNLKDDLNNGVLY